MSNHISITYDARAEIETIVNAMEIVYLKRLMARMLEVWKPVPKATEPQVFMMNTAAEELNALHDLETLRARYVRVVHVDPAPMKADVELFCKEAAAFVGKLAETATMVGKAA